MPKLKSSELRKLDDEELQENFLELRAELIKLRSAAIRGTLKKETGKIRDIRKAIARVLTIMNERKRI
ncbi:MAG: 50S ribosomal protein L29 [Candidatus Methylarchaceae archaeon HK02M1]|nr:50S ribosomal protein L29 [Candidatus Methylarchaceae archaeon HK01M]MCP8312115.1 50S ribosomal protein L29 [Candidatus Methylarchaceae archaeon HK02M1]